MESSRGDATGSPISSAISQCHTLFERLHRILSDESRSHFVSLDDCGDEFGRFRIWQSELGELTQSTNSSSLDERLKIRPSASETLLGFLKDLEDALKDGKYQN